MKIEQDRILEKNNEYKYSKILQINKHCYGKSKIITAKKKK